MDLFGQAIAWHQAVDSPCLQEESEKEKTSGKQLLSQVNPSGVKFPSSICCAASDCCRGILKVSLGIFKRYALLHNVIHNVCIHSSPLLASISFCTSRTARHPARHRAISASAANPLPRLYLGSATLSTFLSRPRVCSNGDTVFVIPGCLIR